MKFKDFLKETNPKFVFLSDRIEKVIGKEPDWQDLTKTNLAICKKRWGQKLSNNTVRMYMATIGSAMRKMDGDIALPKNFEDSIKVKKEGSTSVFLTEQEIESLDKVVVRTNNDMFAKSMFLLQYYTGCRYSDAINLTIENIENNILSYVSKKTKIVVFLPVKPVVKELIDTLSRLKAPTKATYITKVKELCCKASIISPTKIFKGGKDIIAPKYKLVGTHTARRSFATNLALRGADIYTISKLMGHSSTEMTMRYICAEPILSNNIKTFFQ
jgi:integrase